MKRRNQSGSLFQLDFRKRFAQRDLEISRREYEYLADKYLESESASKKAVSEKVESDDEKPQIQEQNDSMFRFQYTPSEFNPDLYKKPEGKKKGAPEDKVEHHLDITLPSILNLIDDYNKPFVYNYETGSFNQVKESWELIGNIRLAIKDRPSPLGISSYEDAYMRATDPTNLLKQTRDKYKIQKNNAVDNTLDRISDVMSAPANLLGDWVANLVKTKIDGIFDKNREYIDDIISTWAVGKNNAEFDTYVDSGIRLGEKLQYANIIKQYNDNIARYILLQQAYDNSTNAGERYNLLLEMNNLLANTSKLRPAVEEAVSYNYDTNVFKTAVRNITEFINNGLNNEFINMALPLSSVLRAGTEIASQHAFGKDDVGANGKQLLDLVDSGNLKPGELISPDFLARYNALSGRLNAYIDDFQKASTDRIAKDKEMALQNKLEALEWEAWHTPSREFKAKEKAALDNYLTSLDTYKYGIWGVLGSSASFNGVQMLSTGLDWLGMGLLMAPDPKAKIAGAGATAVGGVLGLTSGVYENRAEITQGYIQGLQKDLEKEGLLSEFLEEGRRQLKEKGIPVRDELDIFRHFILKDYKNNNPVVQELALRHMFGANNAFQNDMMAVSADVAINAGINLFGATGLVAEALKIFPEGSKFALLRKIAQSPTAEKVYRATNGLGVNTVATALSPLANIPYNVIKPALKATRQAIAPLMKEGAKYMDRALSWSRVAPKGIFNTRTSGKYIFDFLGKTAVRGYSEAVEEGKQYEYGRMFSDGEFAGKSNTIFGTLIDDLSTGLYTSYLFIGNLFFGMLSDRQLLANMRGGFLGGILNHGTAITAVQNFTNARGEINAGSVIFNNVMAEKIRQRANLVNGEEMGKYTSRSGYVAMMNAFDRALAIHDRITNDASDRVGLTQELLNNQRNLFRRISALSNSESVLLRAKELGIKRGSKGFRQLVSLINLADQIQTENIGQYNDLVEQAQAVLNEDGLSLNVVELFNQARAQARSAEEMKAVDAAEDFAKWIQPLNNQVMGQYAALNRLIDELESLGEFLTPAQRKNLSHYKAQREKLDSEVARIRTEIGGTENMDFLNYGDPEVLEKYSSIYRTLFLASAQLETSSVVLNALYGKNNAKDLANEFVKEQLDFIEGRINEASEGKKKAVKSSKKSERNKKAKAIIEQYQKSLNDDIELMAELADRFDNNSYDANNRLDSQSEPLTEEATIEEEIAQEEPSQGALNLPASIYDKIPQEGKIPVGTKIESPALPNTQLTVTGTKVNPTTGQYLIEAVTDDGDVKYIDQDEVHDYQRSLPAPFHYERVLQSPDEWTKFRLNSPLAEAIRRSSKKNLPAVINTELQDFLQDLFRRPLFWDPWDGDVQASVVEHLGLLQTSFNYTYWHPIFGAVVDTGHEKNPNVYIPSVRDIVPALYDEFPSEKKSRENTVRAIIALRSENKINEIRQLLVDNGVSERFLDVIDDNVAVNAIARAIYSNNPRFQAWLQKLAMYTDPEYLSRSGLQDVIAPNGELIFQNVELGSNVVDNTADILTVDKNGRVKIYILVFPRDLTNIQDQMRYYNALGDAMYSLTNAGLVGHIDGIYVLPITDTINQPIPVQISVVSLPELDREIIYRNATLLYYEDIRSEVDGIVQKTNMPGRTRPKTETDLSQETRLQNIDSEIKNLELVIADVYSGVLSFNGKIRVDARQYLENSRSALNKCRNALRAMEESDLQKNLIDRIQLAYERITHILSSYSANAVYLEQDVIHEGDTVKSHIVLIPVGHSLEARTTSGIPITATSDFIVDSKVELMYGWYNPRNNEFIPMYLYSAHPGVGVYAVFTYNGVKHAPVMIQPSHYKDGVQAYTEEGVQFVSDVITLQRQANGLPIIGKASRMIPTPVYKGKLQPIGNIPALHLTIDAIQEITPSSDNVGLTNSANRVLHIDKTEDKSILWEFTSQLSGSIYYLHSFNFKEYLDGGVIPIKLIPNKLQKSDVDVIIDILKQNALLVIQNNRTVLSSPYTVNGKEYPFTAGQVLQLLTTFDTIPNGNSMFWVDDFGGVYFKQRRADKVPQSINVLTLEGERTLRDLISNGYEVAHSRELLNGNLGNPNDRLFGKLHDWVLQNGLLKISDNLVFNKDDVSRNNKGFFGIGWAIKHGRLLSNLSSIYEPSILVESPSVSNNTEQAVVDQPAAAEPKPSNKPKARYVPEDGSLLSAEEEIPVEHLDEEEAREDIRRMLGDAAVEFVDNILGILSNGLKALAATFDDVIIISRLASVGTQFHEAFHRIVELVLDEATRNRVYKAFSNLHSEVDPTNPRSITEGLAEDYRAYARDEKSPNKWKKYFAKIKRFVQAMLNSDRKVLYKLYRDVYRGKYRNIAPSKENIERFNRIFAMSEEDRGVLYHSIYDSSTGERINLPNVPSALEYRTAINTIVDNIVAENGADIFGQSVSKVKFDIESIKKLGAYKAFIGEGQEVDDINKIFIDIFDNWEHVLGDVASSLKRFGLNFRHVRGTNTIETYKTDLSEEEEKAIDEAEDEGKSKTADINLHELQDYEISKLKKMSENTKFFFATIPDIRFVLEDDDLPMYVPETNSRGEEIDIQGRVIQTDPETKIKFIETEDGQFLREGQYKVNMVRNTTYNLNDFGFRQFAPFYATCNIAMNRCYSANDLYELLDMFRTVAIQYPQFNIIAQRFASLLYNMKRRNKDGYYIAKDGRLFQRMDNGLFRQVIGNNVFGSEWYNTDEIDFEIDYNKLSMAVSVFNNISGTKLLFRHVRSTRPSKEAIVFQTMDTDDGYSAIRYTQSWHSTFLSDNLRVRTKEITRNGDRVIVYIPTNANLFRDVAANIKKLLDAYTVRRSEGWVSGRVTIDGKVLEINRDPESVKAEYLRLLNKIGITVTKDQFDHLLFMLFGKTDANALRRYFQQDGEDFGRTKGVSILKFILAIEQGVQLNGELNRTVTSGTFYSNIGAVTQLADAIFSYNLQLSERMLTAPGKNKYYSIANRNAQDLMLQELNTPGGTMIMDYLKSAYHIGSIYLDRLNKGEIVFSSCTDAGYLSDNKSDFGSDFMQITNSEDVIGKITLLLDGYIVPPTMSNKKTYQPILIRDSKTNQVIYLPGTQYIANKNNAQTNNADAEVYSAVNVPVLVDKTFNGEFITMSGRLSKIKEDRMPRYFVVSDEVYDTLIKYAFSEYESILQNLDKNIPDNEKVVNFDTAEKGAKIPGALRFGRFYELYVPRRQGDSIVYDTINLNDNESTVEENLERARLYFFGDGVSRELRISILNEIIERNLDKNLEYFRKVGIIRYRTGWRNLPKYNRYEPVAIDTAHLNAIMKAYGNSILVEGPMSARSIATCALLLDVCLKHQIANEEYQRLFAGYPGLYVTFFDNAGYVTDDTLDLSKRLGGHISTGETQCRLNDVPTRYNCAELRDYKVSSVQKDELAQWFDESESRFTLYASKQRDMSIHVQNLRDNLLSITPKLRNTHRTASDIHASYEHMFEGLEKDDAEMFVELLERVSESTNKEQYSSAVKDLKQSIDTYKYRIVSEEYKRQRQLSLDEVKQELKDSGLLSGAEVRIAAYTANYNTNKINVADGASYVSPIMVKWMLQSIGKFNGKVYKAWESLQGESVLDPLTKAVSYETIMDALFGTLKYTATGYRMNNGRPIDYYNKTALFPLFRLIAYGRTKDILDQMEKDQVHMLMFESAVKFGSQGKQRFPETKEELASFKFNVYSQDFKWLRKLLNTDPKESELMAVGTQTKKIALTILDIYKDDYVKPDGTTETGLTLRDRIFEYDRRLAAIGYEDLMSKFSTKELVIAYIRDNLSERDADGDTLQGLYESPLEGLSNSEWIQSIITSLANKHIIDVNLPGSAFIQRSVFSMEGNNILGDNQIPSIPKLKISNDWSTMDAVVSIDYFYQQFPQLEGMGFFEAREWLINHNIIGENAKADTVAYRIPTQANSSIHALRFIDVISTVRDTIILPEEFTAITGSDFDIDKLFLSTKYYNVDEAGNVSTTFDKTTQEKQYYGNALLDCYIELLSQPKNLYANQLTRSIDYDTEIPKSVVKLLQQGSVNRIGTYDALLLYRQCQIKAENRTGGIGVGPYALNNNNEIMSRLFEVEYANVGIMKALGISRLYDQIDAEGDSVMATIGAFISGHVDIAKGAWVPILNINEYTYDIHLFLARAGLGLRALWFCSQPIMKKLADIYIQAGGYLYDTKNESPYARRRRAFNEFEKSVFVDGNAWYLRVINIARKYNTATTANAKSQRLIEIAQQLESALHVIQQIFGVDPNNPAIKVNKFRTVDGETHEGTILQDIALHHNSEEDIYNPTERYLVDMLFTAEDGSMKPRTVKMSTKDIQFFVYLANIMIDDPVSDMKKLVLLSKIETKKQGKNRAELLSYDLQVSQFFYDGKTKAMLPETVNRMGKGSAILTKQSLFMQATKEMLGNQLLPYTIAYESHVNEFIRSCSLRKDAKTVKSILNGITAWQKYQFIRRYADQWGINMRDLFIGDNSIYNTLGRIRNLIIDYPAVYRKYTDGNGRITNALLDMLQPAYIPAYIQKEYGSTLPKFVNFLINQEDSSAATTDIKAGWEQMLTDQEHPDIQDFARRLIVYAFMTSGDVNVFGGFFKRVPLSWRSELSRDDKDNSYIDYINELIKKSTDPTYLTEDGWSIDPNFVVPNEEVFVEILKNNWFDDNLVPTIQETSRDALGRSVNNYFEYINNGQPILVALVKTIVDEKGGVHYLEASLESPKAVIKIHKHDHDTYNNPQDYRLYKFIRMGTVLNEDGDLISFPIYGRTAPTGGVMYGHTIIQYGDDLNFGWEKDVLHYTDSLDEKFQEGLAQIYDWFELNLDRNKDAVSKGLVTSQELREDTVKTLEDTAIHGSFEDGTPVEITSSSSYLFYNMAKMMSQFFMIHPIKKNEMEAFHNDSLNRIKLPGTQLEEKKEEDTSDIDIWSKNRDRFANLSNVAVRPIKMEPAVFKAISDVFGLNLATGVQKQIDSHEHFDSVEQLFQIVKFEYMKHFLKMRAYELYGLDRLSIAKAKTPEAQAIKQILNDISNKEERILASNGSTITAISHEAIPDLNGIINTEFWLKWNPGGPENFKEWPSYKVMKEIMLQSFLLNPGSTRLLMSTIGHNLTHNKASIYWKEAFPTALMEVRDEIAKTYEEIEDLQNTALTILGGDKVAYDEYTLSIKNAIKGINYDDVTPFFTPEEAELIKAAVPAGSNLRIYSASRHTDPVFYATEIINKLRENFNKPFSDPSRINAIELWSKHDGIPIQNILEACKKYRVAPMVSFSITGLGNTALEKGVMKYNDLLDNIQKLINQGILDPRVTTFRIDPILPGISSISDLRTIIELGVSMGIRKFVTSPMLTYSVQKDRRGLSRSVIPHIDAALMSDPSAIIRYPDAITPDGKYDWMKYYGLHPRQKDYPGAIAFIPKKEVMKPYIDLMEEMMAKHPITIQSCAVAMGNLQPSACLDPAIIEAVTSIKVGAIEDETRPFCKCYGVHSDLFRMNDECNSSCVYCYQGWAKASPFDYYDENGKLKDFSYSKVNDYETHAFTDSLEEPTEVVIKDKKYIYNNDTNDVVDDQGNAVDNTTKARVIWKLAVDMDKAHLSRVNGVYYVVSNTGIIFNWSKGEVESLSSDPKLKEELMKNTQGSYEKPYVSTLFNADELKQLGESRMKFCKTKR